MEKFEELGIIHTEVNNMVCNLEEEGIDTDKLIIVAKYGNQTVTYNGLGE